MSTSLVMLLIVNKFSIWEGTIYRLFKSLLSLTFMCFEALILRFWCKMWTCGLLILFILIFLTVFQYPVYLTFCWALVLNSSLQMVCKLFWLLSNIIYYCCYIPIDIPLTGWTSNSLLTISKQSFRV